MYEKPHELQDEQDEMDIEYLFLDNPFDFKLKFSIIQRKINNIIVGEKPSLDTSNNDTILGTSKIY